MRRSLLRILVDPDTRLPLELDQQEELSDDQIVTGSLRNAEGKQYPITNGIPRLLATSDHQQNQPANSFGFKWQVWNNHQSEKSLSTYRSWLMQRYGFATADEMRAFFGSRRRILEVGCGNGMSASLSLSGEGQNQEWVGIDISVAIDVAQARLGHLPNTHFIQADLNRAPFREKSFDAIFTEGVLHHTPSTEQALKSLIPLLENGGEILFYVYRKKAPIREFTDDYIRNVISPLEPEEALALMRPLTDLGRALADLHAEVEVPRDIPYLGIRAGRHDVQRLIYWHFAKMFWNEGFSYEENNLVNFDWYHPRYAHRHTEEEIRQWCAEENLSIIRFDAQESGFTVRAIKA